MKKHIGRFLVEIAIIFIGITLSFLFEEYRDGRKAAQQMKEIVTSLLTDAELKKKELVNDVSLIQPSIKIIDTCFALSKLAKQVPSGLTDTLVWSITYDYGDFIITSPTYEALSSSGLWQQLPDSLRRQIFHVYNRNYVFIRNTLKMSYEYTANLKKQFFPPLHLDFLNETTITLQSRESDYVTRFNQALKNEEFRVAILLIRNERVKAVQFYKRAIEEQGKLIDSLKKYADTL